MIWTLLPPIKWIMQIYFIYKDFRFKMDLDTKVQIQPNKLIC